MEGRGRNHLYLFIFYFLLTSLFFCYSFTETSYESFKNRRSFFEDFANENNFDPLVADNWYSVRREALLTRKVCKFIFFVLLCDVYVPLSSSFVFIINMVAGIHYNDEEVVRWKAWNCIGAPLSRNRFYQREVLPTSLYVSSPPQLFSIDKFHLIISLFIFNLSLSRDFGKVLCTSQQQKSFLQQNSDGNGFRSFGPRKLVLYEQIRYHVT